MLARAMVAAGLLRADGVFRNAGGGRVPRAGLLRGRRAAHATVSCPRGRGSANRHEPPVVRRRGTSAATWRRRRFDHAMHERALIAGRAIVATVDLAGRRHLTGVAGGPGTLAALLVAKTRACARPCYLAPIVDGERFVATMGATDRDAASVRRTARKPRRPLRRDAYFRTAPPRGRRERHALGALGRGGVACAT